jgi:hypothetical protein
MSSTPPSQPLPRRSNCDECGRSGFSMLSRRGFFHLVTRDEEGLNRRCLWHCCNTARNHCCFDCSIRLYQTNWSCPYCDTDYSRSFIELYGEPGNNGWRGFHNPPSLPGGGVAHGPLWRPTE